MKNLHIVGGNSLNGRCHVPGDKSISHRAIILGSIAEGDSRISNFLDGADCRASLSVMRGLGVQIEEASHTEIVVHGRGTGGRLSPGGL